MNALMKRAQQPRYKKSSLIDAGATTSSHVALVDLIRSPVNVLGCAERIFSQHLHNGLVGEDGSVDREAGTNNGDE
jgi:hypothetical protein